MKKAAFVITLLLFLAACSFATEKKSDTPAKQLAEQLRTQAADEAKSPDVTEVSEAPSENASSTKTAAPTPVKVPPASESTSPEATASPVETVPAESTNVAEEVYEPALPKSTMQDLLNTFATKVQSYQFTYNNSKYSVRGPKIKIILAQPVQVRSYTWPNGTTKSFFNYDTIYVDRSTETATAYCEGYLARVKQLCDQLQIRDLPYPVDYKYYNVVLPQDWLMTWLQKAPTSVDPDKYYVKGRHIILIKYNETPFRTELSFDPLNGLPVRIEQYNDTQIFFRQDFDFLASNKIRAIDVVHRSQDEIPSDEVFMRKNIVNTPSDY